MALSPHQKRHLMEQGFLQIERAVPVELIEAALRAINHSIGEGMPPEQMPIFRARSYCPELTKDSVITRLFHDSSLKPLCEEVFGADSLEPVTGGQIAVRFPALGNAKDHVARGHIDGRPSPNNGVPPGTITSFTGIISVLLSPLPHENAGNFTVWPGTHHKLANHFNQHGAEVLLHEMPNVELGAPHQVVGQPGDAVLAHYFLVHTSYPNTSPHPRYAVFFRLKHRSHSPWPDPRFCELWKDWPGVLA
jgi:hypothetical protein